MRGIFFTALLAVLLPLSSAAQGLGPPRPQRLEGNAQFQRFLFEGREVGIGGLTDEGEPPFFMPRLHSLPVTGTCVAWEPRSICGFRYYLALSGAGTGGRGSWRAVYDLGVLGEITRAEYRSTNGGAPLMLRITVLNLPRWTFETDRPPARRQAVYDIILGPALRVVPAR